MRKLRSCSEPGPHGVGAAAAGTSPAHGARTPGERGTGMGMGMDEYGADVYEPDVYELARLAGGPHRVAEVALLLLRERGLVRVIGSRARSEGPADAGSAPVERALTELCARGASLAMVLAELARGPEVARIGQGLRAARLLGRVRPNRPTAAGRRLVARARRGGAWPAYVFDGPPVLPDRLLRRAFTRAQPPAGGLGKALVRMGKALDRAEDRHDRSGDGQDGGHDGGHSCGGGGGGGGD
ncbi:TIGR04222 domain-containing membrane protein [Streptomyces sp. NPDC090054]|uniref:TIGR04222 domain-containing membrane protein n=1 Tax=Streptomyces sp. NPDC090054 TaxID=3365933 RepID=UPI00380C1663